MTRCVWLADSFAGLPRPDTANCNADKRIRLDRYAPLLAVPEAEVRANFQRYGLLDDQVRFLPGWFKDTLPDAPIDRIAVLRLDGDLYESTIQALDALNPRLSPGGFCIIDDYHSIKACRQAVTDYRAKHGVSAEIVEIDWTVCCGASNDDHWDDLRRRRTRRCRRRDSPMLKVISAQPKGCEAPAFISQNAHGK